MHSLSQLYKKRNFLHTNISIAIYLRIHFMAESFYVFPLKQKDPFDNSNTENFNTPRC